MPIAHDLVPYHSFIRLKKYFRMTVRDSVTRKYLLANIFEAAHSDS